MAEQTYGDLTLTTEQIQARLNQVPNNTDAISALQQAITAFLNQSQVQQLITTALADYSTTTEMNTAISQAITSALASYYTKTAIDTLIASYYTKTQVDNLLTPKQTAAQVSAAITAALADYSTTAEMNTAISQAITSALASYYTKTQVDSALSNKVDKVSGKQLSTEDFTTALKTKLSNLPDATALATQISTAISTALADYSTTSQMNTAIANALTSYYTKTQVDESQATQNERIAALESAVAGLEALAEGYVRVSGSSSPALSYKTYKFNEEGDFSRESAFSIFYPCLIGTKLTGNDDQVGTILHILQKLGYEDGNGMALDIYGNAHAIDGSEGDVMVTNIEKYYRLAGHYDWEGVTYDVFLISREPFSWHGYEAEEIDLFGWAPDYCVSHLDSDNVQRMHSVYNPAWNGSYTAPIGMTGKYIYSQNEETGVITETFDSEATLLGGAGGLHTTDKPLYTGEQEAMNQNPDTTKTVPFMNHTAEGCNAMQALLLAEGGTFDAHNATKFGSGFSSNDGANAAVFEAAGSEARNGLRYVNGQNQTVYMNLNVNNPWGIGTDYYTGDLINSWRNPWHIMEAHRAVSHAVRKGVGELEWFVFEGNKYKYRSVPGFRGPSQGEMTCVVWKVLSSQFTNAAIDPADGTTPLTGRRIDYIISTGLFHGMNTQVSPSWWTSGLVFTEDENRDYVAYMERDQEALVVTPTGDKDLDDAFSFENVYPKVGEFSVGEGYAKDYMDGAMMLPKTNADKTGGGLHTYVGKYNWFTGGAAPAGKKSVRGFRRGDLAYYAPLSPLSMSALLSPSRAATFIGFGTCVRIRRS